MTKIKICGLFREVDIAYVNELLPEYIGFVFYKKSHRNISFDTAKKLKERLDPRIKSAGVFVDEPLVNIKKLAESGIIDIIQLHGSEDEKYINAVKGLTGLPVIKAFEISSEDGIRAAESSSADYILLDNGKGTGKTFDWSLLRSMKKPYFLAGGLDAENITQALKRFSPFAVDTSSGVETNKVKDYNKIKRFIETVRKS